MTLHDLLRVAKDAEGELLTTIGGRTQFRVIVRSGRSGDQPVFIPESTGIERKATNQRGLEEVLAVYNRIRSLKVPDYKETGSQNLSYILRLVQIAADKENGPPALPGSGMLVIDVYLRRGQFFLSRYRAGGHDVEFTSYLLAIAVHACDSAREELLRVLKDRSETETDVRKLEKLRELQNDASNLPRADLLSKIRNHDAHGHPLPFSDPRHVADVLIAGSRRPMEVSSEDGVAVEMRLKAGKPEVRRRPNHPKKGKVKFGDTVSYRLERGRHLVCDFTAGNDMVDLDRAIEEFAIAMFAIRKQL